MKRCPECHFLYEDEQDRCDMDGTSLDFTATLPPLPMLQPVVPQLKSIWSGFTIPLLVLVLLGTVLVILYRAAPSSFGSSATVKKKEAVKPESMRPASEASPEVTAPPISPEPESFTGTQTKAAKSSRALPTNSKEPTAAPASHVQIEPAASPTASAPKAPTSKPVENAASPVSAKPQTYSISAHPKPPPSTQAAQPATSNQEKDSKLKSLFKRAGRIFKKLSD